MRLDRYPRILSLSLAFALTFAGGVANFAEAQQPPPADTSGAHHTSDRRRLVEFLLPEVGMVIGHVIAGASGGLTGAVVGTVIGTTMAIRDSRADNARARNGQLCLVLGSVATPDVTIPGTPPTPAVGDVPGSPGTPDIVIPGMPGTPDHWEVCR